MSATGILTLQRGHTSRLHTSGLSLLLRPCWAGGQLFPLATASEATDHLLGEEAVALPESACTAGASQSEVRSMRLSSARSAARWTPVCTGKSAGALHPMLLDVNSTDHQLLASHQLVCQVEKVPASEALQRLERPSESIGCVCAAQVMQFSTSTRGQHLILMQARWSSEVLPSASSLLVSMSGRSADNLCFFFIWHWRCRAGQDISWCLLEVHAEHEQE